MNPEIRGVRISALTWNANLYVGESRVKYNIHLPQYMGGIHLIKDLEYRGRIYQVTDDGRVFYDGKELNRRYNSDGYLVVSTLDYNRCCRSTGVHRLVALAYIENDDPTVKTEVNHKNYIRDDNRAENLEWLSHANNIRYSVHRRKDMSGENNPNYGNRKLSQIYADNPELSKEKQGRPGLRNGHCRSIDMYLNGQLIEHFDYMSLCCVYLIERGYTKTINPETVRSQINKAVKENGTYKGFTFVKH